MPRDRRSRIRWYSTDSRTAWVRSRERQGTPAARIHSAPAVTLGLCFRGLGGQFTHRPNLDTALTRRRNLGRHLNRLIEISRVEQVETRELLLRFGEGTISHRHLSISHAYCGRGRDRLKRLRGDEGTAVSESIAARHALVVGNGAKLLFFEVHEAEILHKLLVFSDRFLPARLGATKSVDCNSRSCRSRKRRSGSCLVSAMARSYDARASSTRPSRRHKAARAACASR